MIKINALLKKVDFFEKLAIHGRRHSSLKSLGQLYPTIDRETQKSLRDFAVSKGLSFYNYDILDKTKDGELGPKTRLIIEEIKKYLNKDSDAYDEIPMGPSGDQQLFDVIKKPTKKIDPLTQLKLMNLAVTLKKIPQIPTEIEGSEEGVIGKVTADVLDEMKRYFKKDTYEEILTIVNDLKGEGTAEENPTIFLPGYFGRMQQEMIDNHNRKTPSISSGFPVVSSSSIRRALRAFAQGTSPDMDPRSLSSALRRIASAIENSKSPSRKLVARDLNNIIVRIAVMRANQISDEQWTILGFIDRAQDQSYHYNNVKQWFSFRERLERILDEEKPDKDVVRSVAELLKTKQLFRGLTGTDGILFKYSDPVRMSSDVPSANDLLNATKKVVMNASDEYEFEKFLLDFAKLNGCDTESEGYTRVFGRILNEIPGIIIKYMNLSRSYETGLGEVRDYLTGLCNNAKKWDETAK